MFYEKLFADFYIQHLIMRNMIFIDERTQRPIEQGAMDFFWTI